MELPLSEAADAWDAACLAWDDLVDVAMGAHPDLEELRRLMDATAVHEAVAAMHAAEVAALAALRSGIED